MSLINQVLKDLTKKPKPPKLKSNFARLSETYYKKIKQMIENHYFLIICSTLLILIAMSIFSKYVLVKKEIKTPPIPEAKLIEKHAPEKLKPVSADLMNQSGILTGITFEVQKKVTYVRFLLNKDVPYRVSQDRWNRLVIVLEHTQLTTSLPPINTMNSAIKAIQVRNEDDNLAIMLTLNEGAELSRLDLNHVQKLPELQIDLTYEFKTVEQFVDEPSKERIQEAEKKLNVKPGVIKKISYDFSSKESYQKALFFAKEGRNQDAIVTLTNILTKDPEFAPARKSLASLLFEQGNMEKAEELIKTGLQQRPLYSPYIQLKAQIFVIQGKVKEALNLLTMAPPDMRDNPDYYAFMAALYQRNGQSVFAERLYEQLLKMQPSNSIWWMGLGIARESMHKNNEALEAFSMASNTDHLSLELKVYVENRMKHLR